MNRIDIKDWAEFEIGYLFEKVDLKMKKDKFNKATDVSLIKTSEFNLPLVNAKDGNNGIMYYGREADFESAKMCLDIVADGAISTGNVYVQPHNTGVLYNAYLIKAIKYDMPEKALFFIATVMQKTIKHKFGYENKAGWNKVKKEKIKLPVDKFGSPDFRYMEQYIKNLENAVNATWAKLQLAKNTKDCKVQTQSWGEFIIGSLFKKIDLHIIKENFSKKLDVSLEKNDEFTVPLINAKDGNNGIMYYGRKSDFELESMCLDVVKNGAVATGNVYAQPQSTGVLWDAYLIKPLSDISEFALLFLSRVLQTAIKKKYSYDDKAIWDKVKRDKIKLPITLEGQPDWVYMDSFMKAINVQAQSALKNLICI